MHYPPNIMPGECAVCAEFIDQPGGCACGTEIPEPDYGNTDDSPAYLPFLQDPVDYVYDPLK